jgi:hypothetical protein
MRPDEFLSIWKCNKCGMVPKQTTKIPNVGDKAKSIGGLKKEINRLRDELEFVKKRQVASDLVGLTKPNK